MNVCAKPEPGIETNGALKFVAIAFDIIVLPVPGAPNIIRPRSPLASGLLEHLARLPQGHDASHVLLCLGLPTDVVELDAPVSVAGLVGADLRESPCRPLGRTGSGSS